MRTKVFYNLPDTACYGCYACAQICPVEAIQMRESQEGFMYPHIDSEKCIECNACEGVCPTQLDVLTSLFHSTPENVYAAWEHSLMERLMSTSGGVFFVLGKKCIDNGGVVYGAVFDRSLKVVHSRVEDVHSLEAMRGSKYVQSDLTSILRSIRIDLRKGVKVLFSGTPCQIGGLRSFLKRDYPNLLCVDLVCHGVPSPSVFASHLKYIEKSYKDRLVDYKFRGKDKSGWRAYIKYFFSNKKVTKKLLEDDFFAHCFYKSLFNRKSCYICGFSCSQRVGDITLSDFWGAERYNKKLRRERKYGFNMVMCNTAKGLRAFEDIKQSLTFISLPTKAALEGDVRLRHPEPEPADRHKMFEKYFRFGYDTLASHYESRKKSLKHFLPIVIKNIVCEIRTRL